MTSINRHYCSRVFAQLCIDDSENDILFTFFVAIGANEQKKNKTDLGTTEILLINWNFIMKYFCRFKGNHSLRKCNFQSNGLTSNKYTTLLSKKYVYSFFLKKLLRKGDKNSWGRGEEEAVN